MLTTRSECAGLPRNESFLSICRLFFLCRNFQLISFLFPLSLHKTSVSHFGLARNLVNQHGLRILWTGLTASVLRQVPGTGMYFGALHILRRATAPADPAAPPRKLEPLYNLVTGAGARALAAAALVPVTVVKARYESGRFAYSGVLQALVSIGRTEGVRGLYAGLVPTLVRDMPFSGLYLALYDGMKPAAAALLPFAPIVVTNGAAGMVAGILASLATHPPDVVKTRVQVGGHELQAGLRRSSLATAWHIVREEGVHGLFRGATPRIVRRSLVAAINWSIYEQLVGIYSDWLDRDWQH